MLLSDKSLAQELDSRYVLSWESVRPVPKATIDFGNGEVITRTLKGNNVFYLCNPEGVVQDIFPGVYTPEDFLSELNSSDSVAQALPDPIEDNIAMIGKGRVESSILSSFELAKSSPKVSPLGVRDISSEAHTHKSLELLTKRELTIENDSQASITVLRPAARKFLEQVEPSTPSELTSAVYSKVLGIDLSDPYLGLLSKGLPGVD